MQVVRRQRQQDQHGENAELNEREDALMSQTNRFILGL